MNLAFFRDMVLKVDGQLDHSLAPRIRGRLFEAVEASDGTLLVDLSAVGSLDTSGVAIFVEALRLSKRRGRRFGFLNPSRAVMAMVGMMRLSNLFRVEYRAPQPIPETVEA